MTPETVIVSGTADAYSVYRATSNRLLYAYLLDGSRATETEADKKWHRARRKAQSELDNLEKTARAG